MKSLAQVGIQFAARTAGRIAHRRSAPALHPFGVSCQGELEMHSAGPRWGQAWVDEPGHYEVSIRWSRATGLPARWPDALGLALRVHNADGHGRPLDLLLTSSGAGRLTRHVPLPRGNALSGPYSTLLAYRVGNTTAVLDARPVTSGARMGGDLIGLRSALHLAPRVFRLGASRPGEGWRHLGTITTGAPLPASSTYTSSYDPYLHHLPDLHPTTRLRRLREAAYAASRAGRRTADRPAK